MTLQHHPVPVTVLGGTRAAVLADLVSEPGDLIVAERWYGPGSVVIRPETRYERGRPDCPVRLDVADGVLRAVRRASRPERVLLLARSNDDLAAIAFTLLSDDDLMRHVWLDGIVVTLDAVQTATRLAERTSLGAAVELDALAMADAIVLTRSNELTENGATRLRSVLREVNHVGSTLIEDGRDPTRTSRRSELRNAITDLDAWRGRPFLRKRTSSPGSNGHEMPQTLLLRQTQPLDLKAVAAWLDGVVETHATGLLRLQGVLAIDSMSTPFVCHGVRSFAVCQADAAPEPADRGDSLVVIVGRGLDADELISEFAATRVR